MKKIMNEYDEDQEQCFRSATGSGFRGLLVPDPGA